MNTIARRLSLVAVLSLTFACGRDGALCGFNDRGCCSDDEYEDEDGECAGGSYDGPDPLPPPDGEFGFSASVSGLDAYDGATLVLAVRKAGLAWCGAAGIENGAADLGTDSEVVAGGMHYWVYWGVDVNEDGWVFPSQGEPAWEALVETAPDGETHVTLDAATATTAGDVAFGC